jgi:2-dehydropantoate 2-reductase
MWEKFVLASASLGVPALTRLPVGPVMACPETRALCRAVMAETVAVARAHGVPLPDDLVDRHLALLARLPPGARPSMLQDMLAGRRLEVAYLHGALVRLARERGLAAPVAATIAAALQPSADGAPDVPPPP